MEYGFGNVQWWCWEFAGVWRCGYSYMLGWFYVVIMTIHDIL